MRAIVGADIEIVDCEPSVEAFFRKKLTFTNPEYVQKMNRGLWLGNTPETLTLVQREGRCVVLTEEMALALSAGARSIENNKRLHGTIYVLDPFGANKEIPYLRAARILREAADAALNWET